LESLACMLGMFRLVVYFTALY